MDEDVLNMSLRKFLKKVGVTSQREIEKAIRDAVEAGRIPATGKIKAKARVTLEGTDLDVAIDGNIDLG
jgi:16S rRNA U516 pseudouridylate synthase RsuA-like enzyme